MFLDTEILPPFSGCFRGTYKLLVYFLLNPSFIIYTTIFKIISPKCSDNRTYTLDCEVGGSVENSFTFLPGSSLNELYILPSQYD